MSKYQDVTNSMTQPQASSGSFQKPEHQPGNSIGRRLPQLTQPCVVDCSAPARQVDRLVQTASRPHAARFSMAVVGSVVSMMLTISPAVGKPVLQTKPPVVSSAPDETPIPREPRIEAASGEASDAIANFKIPDGIVCHVFAAEPDVANVVAFHRDYQGRLFACETFRQEKGVEDNRNHGDWMDEELAAQTVQDRINYIKKYVPDAATSYTENDDRIRLLVDTNGDGRADRSTVFSKHYNRIEMGTGAGVLSYRGNVYYTCIPSLFLLNDQNQDGIADIQLTLQTGYGVRFAFRGHDMHGLIVGPDGRIYFSIGDRGYNVSAEIKDPASGAVFRCEPDGSKLEVVATGLRNPQELAFDDYGNLFTGDNNSDSGDRARFTEIIPGGDSGWRMHYQYIPDRGPFNRERIWEPYNEETPAYIVPPVANISDGPSGLAFYPGTGFGDRFRGKFLLCDFRGNASVSGIRAFGHQPAGAGWKLVDETSQPFWNMLVTDLDFGSDGKLYVSDWVYGWEGVNKGRIYAFHDPKEIGSDLVREVEQTLRFGMRETSVEQLVEFLHHADRRVRTEAQFELVRRKSDDTLKEVLADRVASSERIGGLARVHAIWGLTQRVRQDRNSKIIAIDALKWLLEDPDPQVRIAALKLIAEMGEHLDEVRQQLAHRNLRVRFQAALALNQVGTSADVDALATMIEANDNRDPYLRHAAVMGLVGIFERDPNPIESGVGRLTNHDSAAVRLAASVAFRKVIESNRPGTFRAKQGAATRLGQLLGDADPKVVTEAARAIHDLPVRSQMKSLAALAEKMDAWWGRDPLVRRVMNANFRVGTQAAARTLATLALNEDVADDRRVEAVQWLGQWANPPERDHVLHDWRPLNKNRRNVIDARNALSDSFRELMKANDRVATVSIQTAGDLKLTSIGEDLLRLVADATVQDSSRIAALQSLDRMRTQKLPAVLRMMIKGGFETLSPELKTTLIDVASRILPAEESIPLIENVLQDGPVRSQQQVIATLGQMSDGSSATLLQAALARMIKGDYPTALRLDLLAACDARSQIPELATGLATYRNGLSKTDLTMRYQDCLQGGTAELGEAVFFEKTEVSCVRCHKVGSRGGEVGPELSSIGLTRDRKYLLESIVDPNKQIANGYAQTKLVTDDGRLIVGLVKQETEDKLVLLDADGKDIIVEKDIIEDSMIGNSSMPVDLHTKLTPAEIRDLVEYLVNRKADPNRPKLEHE